MVIGESIFQLCIQSHANSLLPGFEGGIAEVLLPGNPGFIALVDTPDVFLYSHECCASSFKPTGKVIKERVFAIVTYLNFRYPTSKIVFEYLYYKDYNLINLIPVR